MKGRDEIGGQPANESRKKRKWKVISSENVGFNFSLFPRTVNGDVVNIDEDDFCPERELSSMSKFGYVLDYEGRRAGCACLRRDKDRKKRKAHKEVGDKYGRSVRNNRGRKKLYVHYRVYKRMGGLALAGSRTVVNPEQIASKNIGARPENTLLALDITNAPGDFSDDLVSGLIALQDRDLTPEDYDLLLQLDECISPKTVVDAILRTFEEDSAGETNVRDVCAICMENYELGEKRKILPCQHVFHLNCIIVWLSNSSTNCPLDGLPV